MKDKDAHNGLPSRVKFSYVAQDPVLNTEEAAEKVFKMYHMFNWEALFKQNPAYYSLAATWS